MEKRQFQLFFRVLSVLMAISFTLTTIVPPNAVYAQALPQTVLNLPIPGTMVSTTDGFAPVLINGLTLHPENPLQIDFIVNTGDTNIQGDALKIESTTLIKYFLAALTIPNEDMWVNLSPYEKDRVIPDNFGDTKMGRDLLAQDYMLKQLTASLMFPEEDLGENFWNKVYEKAYAQFGTTDIPMDTFHKIWIVPEKAEVYEHEASAFVVGSHLKVMLEEDYEALNKNKINAESRATSNKDQLRGISTEIIREILIPAIEKEVNEGTTFAKLRQIYNSVILATWYKDHLQESLLGKIYVNQNKTLGVDTQDKQISQKIYAQYVESFKKGAYDFIKEDYDSVTEQVIPRKYFSGGLFIGQFDEVRDDLASITPDQAMALNKNDNFIIKVDHAEISADNSEVSPKINTELSLPASAEKKIDAMKRDLKAERKILHYTSVQVDDLSEDRSDGDGLIFYEKGQENSDIETTEDIRALVSMLHWLANEVGGTFIAQDSKGNNAGEIKDKKFILFNESNVSLLRINFIKGNKKRLSNVAGLRQKMRTSLGIKNQDLRKSLLEHYMQDINPQILDMFEKQEIVQHLYYDRNGKFFGENRLITWTGYEASAIGGNKIRPSFEAVFAKIQEISKENDIIFKIKLDDGFKGLPYSSEFILPNTYLKAEIGNMRSLLEKKPFMKYYKADSTKDIFLIRVLDINEIVKDMKENQKEIAGSAISEVPMPTRKSTLVQLSKRTPYVPKSVNPGIGASNNNGKVVEAEFTVVDTAMSTAVKDVSTGGINLDPAMIDMQIKRDGNGVPLAFEQQPDEAMLIDGIVPVILKIIQIPSMFPLLGFSSKDILSDFSRTFPDAWPAHYGLSFTNRHRKYT